MNKLLVNQKTNKPTNKVTSGTLAGVLVTALVAVLAQFNVVVPEDVSTAAVTAVGAAVVVVQFVAGYLKRDRK